MQAFRCYWQLAAKRSACMVRRGRRFESVRGLCKTRDAGIDRSRDVVNWNIVPWYLGDANKIGNVRTSDIDEARPALVELLSRLAGLRVVVLCGRKAQAGWDRAQLTVDLPVLRVPHPSGRWLNAHPEHRDKIVAALVEARRLAYQDE